MLRYVGCSITTGKTILQLWWSFRIPYHFFIQCGGVGSFFKSPHWKHLVVGYAKSTPKVEQTIGMPEMFSTIFYLHKFPIHKPWRHVPLFPLWNKSVHCVVNMVKLTAQCSWVREILSNVHGLNILAKQQHRTFWF